MKTFLLISAIVWSTLVFSQQTTAISNKRSIEHQNVQHATEQNTESPQKNVSVSNKRITHSEENVQNEELQTPTNEGNKTILLNKREILNSQEQ